MSSQSNCIGKRRISKRHDKIRRPRNNRERRSKNIPGKVKSLSPNTSARQGGSAPLSQ